MGDRIGVQLPLREIYLSLTNQTDQLSLAIPLWVGPMSTGQRAVMLCNWGVEADMVLFAGNIVWSISECVRGICIDALYKSTFTKKNVLNVRTNHTWLEVCRCEYFHVCIIASVFQKIPGLSRTLNLNFQDFPGLGKFYKKNSGTFQEAWNRWDNDSMKHALTDAPHHQLFFEHTVHMHCCPEWTLHKTTPS